MANTLSAIAPTMYSAAKEVANEPTALVSAINMNFDDKGVAKGDTVDVPVAPTRAEEDFTPAATSSTGDDATATDISVSISHSKKVSWNLSGEQQRSLQNAENDQEWVRQLIAQGMRTLRNGAEAVAYDALRVGASRAYGTAGTTPFASDLSAFTNARKILKDNGAPMADLHFVGDTNAELNLSNLGIIQQANQAGSDAERRSGNLGRQFGFALHSSAAIDAITKGTGSGYLVNNASGYAVGDSTIAADTGTGTILAGDIVTIGNHKYVVKTALSGGSFSIGAPGLREAVADNAAITVGANFTANLAFERSAFVGVMRPPLMPANPTQSTMLVSDPQGLTYLMMEIAQYGQISWELHLAYGFKPINDEFAAVVLG